MSIYEPTFPQWRKGKEPGKEAGPAGARGLRDFRHIASLAFDPPKIKISEEEKTSVPSRNTSHPKEKPRGASIPPYLPSWWRPLRRASDDTS